ncbi:hypothetical protein MHM97_21805 [Epibacterium sp. Ofav1-8]|nr:hypothetical protein [Epibacterium sp. Ofav1-8]
MDRICLPCAGLIRVEACYRDAWTTPLTNACVRVEDSTGVVVDGAVRTEPLIAHGLKDGDAPTAPLTTMGTTPPIEVAQGTSEVTLVPQGAGEADAGMGDLGAALAGFRDDALVKLQPYVLEWEARGLLSIPEARFRGVGKGLSAWYQGEADFWGGVSDRAVAAYQNAQNWHDAYVARQSPFEQGMMQYGGPFGAIAVYGTSLVETAAETVSDWISGADDLAAYIATIMAAMRDLASGTVDLMEAALDSLRALPGETGRLFAQLIDNGQDWIERLVLIASETNAFEYVFHVFMAVAMNMTPNFWAEMAGVVSGFLLPEVLIEIILAVIAAFTGGGGIALLAGRLATFVAKLRGLAVKAKSLGVLASIVEAFGKAITALGKIGKGLHDEIEAFTRAGADGVARIRHRVNQYKVEIDPNTLGMNGGNIRITRKRRAGLTDEKIKEIVGTPKGQRPDPSTYMSKAEIDEHLAKFDDGAVRVTPASAIDQYGTAGPPGGFVMPKSEFDNLVQKSGGNLANIEKRLGLDAGSLSNGEMVAVRIDPEDFNGLRIPSGNELGANSHWLPGGYTSGGAPEAVMDFDGVPFEVMKIGNQ